MKHLRRAIAAGFLASCFGCDNSSGMPKEQPAGDRETETVVSAGSQEAPSKTDLTQEKPATPRYSIAYYDRQSLIDLIGETAETQPELASTQWSLAAYGYEDELTRITPLSGAYFAVSGEPLSQIGGSDGCNRFGGSLQATEEGWTAHSIMRTLRACYALISIDGEPIDPDRQKIMNYYRAQEAFFYDVIKNVTNIEVSSGVLFLTSAESKMLAFSGEPEAP